MKSILLFKLREITGNKSYDSEIVSTIHQILECSRMYILDARFSSNKQIGTSFRYAQYPDYYLMYFVRYFNYASYCIDSSEAIPEGDKLGLLEKMEYIPEKLKIRSLVDMMSLPFISGNQFAFRLRKELSQMQPELTEHEMEKIVERRVKPPGKIRMDLFKYFDYRYYTDFPWEVN